jgi:hypothetical protein
MNNTVKQNYGHEASQLADTGPYYSNTKWSENEAS